MRHAVISSVIYGEGLEDEKKIERKKDNINCATRLNEREVDAQRTTHRESGRIEADRPWTEHTQLVGTRRRDEAKDEEEEEEAKRGLERKEEGAGGKIGYTPVD